MPRPTITEAALDSLTVAEMRSLVEALQSIARGRTNNGKPLSTETARQTARVALTQVTIGW